jgi:hypothetical protein
MASDKGGKTVAKGRARPAARRKQVAPEKARLRLPRDPKGRRAQFYDDPAVDQLWAILLALTAEVSVAFDRIDTLERLLQRAWALRPGEIDAYLPDEATTTEKNRRREELIQRVFQVLSQYERTG